MSSQEKASLRAILAFAAHKEASFWTDPDAMKSDPRIIESTERILADLCDSATVNDAEDGEWPQALWEALGESGLVRAWIPEESGGVGADLVDGFAIARRAAAHAAPIPLAETLLAGWLVGDTGLAPPSGPLGLLPVDPSDRIVFADGGISRLRTKTLAAGLLEFAFSSRSLRSAKRALCIGSSIEALRALRSAAISRQADASKRQCSG